MAKIQNAPQIFTELFENRAAHVHLLSIKHSFLYNSQSTTAYETIAKQDYNPILKACEILVEQSKGRLKTWPMETKVAAISLLWLADLLNRGWAKNFFECPLDHYFKQHNAKTHENFPSHSPGLGSQHIEQSFFKSLLQEFAEIVDVDSKQILKKHGSKLIFDPFSMSPSTIHLRQDFSRIVLTALLISITSQYRPTNIPASPIVKKGSELTAFESALLKWSIQNKAPLQAFHPQILFGMKYRDRMGAIQYIFDTLDIPPFCRMNINIRFLNKLTQNNVRLFGLNSNRILYYEETSFHLTKNEYSLLKRLLTHKYLKRENLYNSHPDNICSSKNAFNTFLNRFREKLPDLIKNSTKKPGYIFLSKKVIILHEE